MKKYALISAVLALVAVILFFACDNRTPITRSKPPVTFQAELTAVKDYTQGLDLVELQFKRDSQPFSDAKITIGQDTLQSVGNGIYSGQSPVIRLFSRSNSITFASPTDLYSATIAFDIPDSFAITSLNPRYNPGAVDVQAQWSHPAGATGLILSVISRDYPGDDTSPLSILLAPELTIFTIPDTTFETSIGLVQPGVYYVYLVAYNGGFGPYSGRQFPLPANVPARAITNPSGHLRVGTVAPVDSITIPL